MQQQQDVPPTVSMPSHWLAKVVEQSDRFCREIRNVDTHAAVVNLTQNAPGPYYSALPYLNQYENPKVLEMGTGYGFGLCFLKKMGVDATGIEPGNSAGFEGRYDMAIELLQANDIASPETVLIAAVGEALPFDNNSFDVVYSEDVLEHVQDIRKCLTEAVRVTKPGGSVVFKLPNYNAYREQHYFIPWFPHLLKSKSLAKWYVRTIHGRQDWFIDEMHFITPGFFRKLSASVPELSGAKISYYLNPRIPILSKFFNAVLNQRNALNGKAGFANKLRFRMADAVTELGEFLGMVEVFIISWSPLRK